MDIVTSLKAELDEMRQQRITDHELYQDMLQQNPDMAAEQRKQQEDLYTKTQQDYDEKIRELELRLDAAIEQLRKQ